MKKVLLTRSKEDNIRLEEVLKPLHFSLVSCPLILYEDLFLDSKLLENFTDIIITSKRAARIIIDTLTGSIYINSFRFWVVGDTSAKILREKGFKVEICAANVNHLESQLPKSSLKNFIYLSSSEITKELPVKRHIIYKVRYRVDLSQNMREFLKKGIDYILIYSHNSGKALFSLLEKNNLLIILKTTTIIAISSKAGHQFNSYAKRLICGNNNPSEMLKLLINDARR